MTHKQEILGAINKIAAGAIEHYRAVNETTRLDPECARKRDLANIKRLCKLIGLKVTDEEIEESQA